MSGRLLIGLDSGGAKTAAALCDGEGRVLARARDRGAAIVGLPDARFFEVVGGVLGRLGAEAGVDLARVERVAIGLSGVDYPDEQARQHAQIAQRLGLEERLDLVNDGLVALWGVSPTRRAALVQHGSGITTAYRDDYGREAIYDSLDVAEVYDIRRAAFARTARMIDGRAEPTSLRERVLAHCGVAAEDFAEWAFRHPKVAAARRLAVAGVVFAARSDGDAAAAEMIQAAAADYVLAVRAMSARLEGPFEAAFGGGVIAQGGAAFQAVIGERLAREVPQARLTPVALPPEFGAALLAAHGCGLDPERLFANLASLESAP
ncbi:BadF/BadG/BcrA/BcrD ATPase family protein [Phenylobacterium sp.]|uniref:BadF/BadG/BcrA/BcrD ATPase family protein n=1 Tax=Phenylobacterium sp. TaxID=1871053 RepID=UPI002897065D|nr:BadF/BadG/BcrA/BcrD ATPase family protein [Phenylobacterium sp.]